MKRFIGAILGASLMFFAVGAYFSNEPASKTDNGRIMIVVALMFGFMTFLNSVFPKQKESNKQINSQPNTSKCPKCGKEVKQEFNVCPYCGESLNQQK